MSLPPRTVAGGVCVCEDDIPHPMSLYFTQNWIMINYDGSAQINADAAFSTVSPAHTLSWVASSLQNRSFVTHGWKGEANIQIRFYTVSMEIEFYIFELIALESLGDCCKVLLMGIFL